MRSNSELLNGLMDCIVIDFVVLMAYPQGFGSHRGPLHFLCNIQNFCNLNSIFIDTKKVIRDPLNEKCVSLC